jgi:hypothetical protein
MQKGIRMQLEGVIALMSPADTVKDVDFVAGAKVALSIKAPLSRVRHAQACVSHLWAKYGSRV